MVTNNDIQDAVAEAKLVLLQRIIKSTGNAQAVMHLAEAYAWLAAPAQDHGGSSKSA